MKRNQNVNPRRARIPPQHFPREHAVGMCALHPSKQVPALLESIYERLDELDADTAEARAAAVPGLGHCNLVKNW